MTFRAGLILGLAAFASLAPLALAVASWPTWWALIASEATPMTWLESVVLVLGGAGCAALWYVTGKLGEKRAIWLLLAAGFAELALDERFALHERIRDRLIAPRGISVPFLPWVGPGDFLLLIVALVGLALLPWLWRAMQPDPGARRALLLGVSLAIIAVGMDSFDPARMGVEAERLEQTLEEVVELMSGSALLGAILLRLTTAIDALALGAAHRQGET